VEQASFVVESWLDSPLNNGFQDVREQSARIRKRSAELREQSRQTLAEIRERVRAHERRANAAFSHF
jgi:hypothetical protein